MYKEVKEPVFHELTIEKGKNYEFNNSYSNAMNLVTSANNSSSENRYDIIKIIKVEKDIVVMMITMVQ